MRAAVRDRYGPPEVVRVEDVPTPTPTGDQVLVRVRAASVNRADLDGLYPRWQFTRLISGVRVPKIRRLGLDVAGVVESVGPEVTSVKTGDRVFGDLFAFGSGAFGEYVCVPQRALATIPDGLSFQEAAALPHSAILAIQGLRLRNGETIAPGQQVLIVGASGNVGPFAVQIAKARGAVVTGIARTEKLDFVQSLGVDHVIDYTTTDYTKTGERYDWIVDTDSHHSILAIRRALKRGGVYVTLGGSAWPILEALALGPVVGRATGRSMGLLLWWKPFDHADVATITGLIDAGAVTPAIDRRYPLTDIVAALRRVHEGQAMGKVIVTVAEPPAGG